MHILIAEDEPRIARFVERGLKANGFSTTVVEDGLAALDVASSGDVDLVILDIGLPRMDGLTVVRTLRTLDHDVPVILATARGGVEDTVDGLESGANDYIAKPFRFEELLARVKLRAREHDLTVRSREEKGQSRGDAITVGDLTLDLLTRTVRHAEGGTEVVQELSAREFALASVFVQNPDQVLTRDLLLSRVWGYDYEGASNIVDVYVGYLRAKVGAERIQTIRGAGYLWNGQDLSSSPAHRRGAD